MIPDILCNAEGVLVSYLEYTEEPRQEQMTEETVLDRLERRMKERFILVADTPAKRDSSTRDAAALIALSRVCDATLAKWRLR
jgi:glutamate dehydrogenase (NAD(P)+)